ncbi:hypothetical protein GCM10022237_08920 [Nocardioides ginsengisoli]|uniref:Uncharacterized protein n=1 Tax=Nocardioides ginsengisoli TaxID=363868 RepID=A0ABW3W133_9ACTN
MASKKDQVAEVVEGLGLGLAALGVRRVSSWKLDIEFSFSHAWREWAHADEYPSIGRAVKPDNEFWIGVTNSERRKWPVVAWRSDGADYVIDLRDRTPGEAAESLSDRPLDQWIALATPYRERLDEMIARRAAEGN